MKVVNIPTVRWQGFRVEAMMSKLHDFNFNHTVDQRPVRDEAPNLRPKVVTEHNIVKNRVLPLLYIKLKLYTYYQKLQTHKR